MICAAKSKKYDQSVKKKKTVHTIHFCNKQIHVHRTHLRTPAAKNKNKRISVLLCI